MGFFRKSKWTLESREGRDTPSFEELFYFLITPGATYHTAMSDNPEMGEYLSISTLLKIGGFALAADAVLAAEAAGTTAMYSEFVMFRGLQTVTRIPVALAVASPLLLYGANKAVIESAPEEEQQSLWQIFGQAISGTGQPGIHHIPGS